MVLNKRNAALKAKRVIYNHPALRRFLSDPFIHGEICGMVDNAEMMGYDFEDSELMGGFIVNAIKKIASNVRKRREAKKSNSQSTIPSISVQTSQGTAALGPGGLTWTGQQNIPIGNTGMSLQTVPQQETILDKVKSNPVLLAIPAGALVLFMVMSKKRSEEK